MAHTPSRVPAIAWGCLAAFTWGLTGTFIKLLPSFSTVEILAIRTLLSLAITLVIFLFRPALWSESLSLLRRPVGLLLSSLMLFYYLFAVRAFQLAPVSDVALVVGLSPIIGLAVKVMARQRLASIEIIGAGTAFAGLILFVSPKIQGVAEGDHATYLTGLGFALLAACISLGYAALFKHYAANHSSLSPIAVSCTTFVIGSAIVTPIVAASSPNFIAQVMQPDSLKIALGLGIVCTVVPTFCYSYAAKHLPPILTTTLNLLVPIFAAVLAFFFIQETMPAVSVLGAALIIVGIVVLSSAKPAIAQPKL